MIGYAISRKSLLDHIETESPDWLVQAKQKTAKFKHAKEYKETVGSWSTIKSVYVALQHGKCGYCERLLEEGERGKVEWDVEHFRPKGLIRIWPEVGSLQAHMFSFSTGAASTKGYYLLSYHPLNYLASCKTCNSGHKASFFPIGARRRSLAAINPELLTKERAFLIYPIGEIDDNPEDLITFQGFVCVPVASRGPKRHRAMITITLFGLNERDTLLKARAEEILRIFMCLERLHDHVEDHIAIPVLRRALQPGQMHANCLRSFIKVYRTDLTLAKIYVAKALAYLASVESA